MADSLLCVAGTAAFCVLLNVPRKRLLPCVFGGVVSAFAFLAAQNRGAGIFTATFLAMLLLCAYSELFARLLRAPAALMLLPGSIPLLPGGSLYYMMSCLVHSQTQLFYHFARETVLTGAGIALGAVVSSIFVRLFLNRASP